MNALVPTPILDDETCELKTYRLVIFDCDGTLSDSRATIVSSVQTAFATHGLPVPTSMEIQRRVGLSLEEFVRDLCPGRDVDVAGLVADYRRDARAQLTRSGADPLFAGTRELVEELSRQGVLLAVATGKSQRGLRALLEGHKILEHFSSLQTADDAPSKPHPAMIEQALSDCGVDPSEAVMVGDTVFDMEAAATAGVDAVGVGWGYHREEELRAAGAIDVADDLTQLANLLGLADAD
jgi:phosphoglycolate phosphatase